MKKKIKKIITLLLGHQLGSKLISFYQMKRISAGMISYSQEGEDRLLANLLRGNKSGFYVDIGAHHPYCLSNTHLFYRKGWRGINIDANPNCMTAFHRYRKRDINITAGVGNSPGEMVFYKFEEAALSSFDKKLSLEREANGRKIQSKVSIKIQPLRELLVGNIPFDTKIEFMSIDVEGLDLDVLKSNDWDRFRPHYLLVECIDLEIEKITENESYLYLKDQGYKFFAKLINTCFFVDMKA